MPSTRDRKTEGPKGLIQEALSSGRSTLDEYESKRFLEFFSIPVIRESVVQSVESAAVESARIGFPIALKACGKTLLHKTEAGAVVLNVASRQEAKKQSSRLLQLEGCETLLVQKMVTGHRDFICGLKRDASFGPCVVFGLGGILTELLSDVAFRVAPLTTRDAKEMIGDIRCNQIVEPFRGESAVDTAAVAHILISLGEIGIQHPEVLEIDINPMKIRPDGSPVSIDALVTLSNQR